MPVPQQLPAQEVHDAEQHDPEQRRDHEHREDPRDALLRANQAYLAAGGTSVHDAGGLIGPPFSQCQDLVAAEQIQVRLYAFTTVKPIPLQLDGELLALDPGTPVRIDIAPAALATLG